MSSIQRKIWEERAGLTETKYSYGGGSDNAGGHHKFFTASDGTTQSIYVPGKKYQQSSSIGHEPIKAEPKHPLHGHQVTDGKVHGRLMGTARQGSVAKIKDHKSGNIHYVDAKDIKQHKKTDK